MFFPLRFLEWEFLSDFVACLFFFKTSQLIITSNVFLALFKKEEQWNFRV